jgi:hypothetical protein
MASKLFGFMGLEPNPDILMQEAHHRPATLHGVDFDILVEVGPWPATGYLRPSDQAPSGTCDQPENRPYFLAYRQNPAIYRAISHGSMALKGRPVAAGP